MDDEPDSTRRALVIGALGLAGLGGAAEIIAKLASRPSSREATRAGLRSALHPTPHYEADAEPPKAVIEAVSDRSERTAD